MRKIIFVLILMWTIQTNVNAQDDLPPLPQGPLLLTSVTQEQLNPDYWINRLPNPDQPLKTPDELKFFNDEIRQMARDRVDVLAKSGTMKGSSVREVIQQDYDTVSKRHLFDVAGERIAKTLFESRIKPNLRIESIPDKITIRWAAATDRTSVRALPTNVKMLEEVGDVEFDQLQFTLIKLWTPVAVYHTTQDGQWAYLQAPYVRGWAKTKDLAFFENKAALKTALRQDHFLSVTGESVVIYRDVERTQPWMRASMGTLLPYSAKDEHGYEISMPTRDPEGKAILNKAYLDARADVSEGFPAFTQRNIITQAFKLLGQRYGWGGMYDGRDCSGFTHDVFLSLGVDLPRDSKNQVLVGTQLAHFPPFEHDEDKLQILREATPALTLLKMPLHIMLYLGEVDGKPYVIHSTWAERISMTSDEKVRINQVVVSDLSLNGNSRSGSLFDRIVSMNELN